MKEEPGTASKDKKELSTFSKIWLWLEIFMAPVIGATAISFFYTYFLQYKWTDWKIIYILLGGAVIGIIIAELIRRFVGLKTYNETSLISTNDIDEAIEEERERGRKIDQLNRPD